MAKVVQLIDDLDSSPIDEEIEGSGTLIFSVAGDFYSIDLSAKNRAAFDKAIQKYVDHALSIEAPNVEEPARRRGRGPGRAAGVPVAANKERLQLIREWGRANGYEISDRGRVAQEIQNAYDEAHA